MTGKEIRRRSFVQFIDELMWTAGVMLAASVLSERIWENATTAEVFQLVAALVIVVLLITRLIVIFKP